MPSTRVRASLIVRVVEGRGGCRVVVHDLRRGEVRSFASWSAALRYLQGVVGEDGLR